MTHVGDCPVVERVGWIALRYHDRVAVVGPEKVLRYGELWDRVNAWRERCLSLRLPPGSLVAVQSGDGSGLPAAFLGARAAGLVPLLLDSGLPRGRTAAVQAAARPAAVLVANTEAIELTGEADPPVLPPEAGYVVFSSGTQGVPKGIVGQAAGLLAFVDWEIGELDVHPGIRVAMLTSPAFDVVYRDMLLALCSGGELHVPDRHVRFAPSAVLAWLAERKIEVLHAVPSLSARWLEAAGQVVNSVRHTLFAGEPLYGRHVRRWRQAVPDTRVVNLYGPAETTLARFYHHVPDDCGDGLQPVGRPLPGGAVALVPVGPAGTHGDVRRVEIATPDGSLGYLPGTCSLDDLARLRREDGVTRFQTQDRGLLTADGDLVVAGRLDSNVKRRGIFVDIMRVEAVAAELPEVRAACCVQLESSSEIVLAVLGPDQVTAARLRHRLRVLLGAEVPDRVVAVASLPLLPGGKADRRGVRELLNLEDTA